MILIIYTILGGSFEDEGKEKVVIAALEHLCKTDLHLEMYDKGQFKETSIDIQAIYRSISTKNKQFVPKDTIFCVRFNGGDNAGHTIIVKSLVS